MVEGTNETEPSFSEEVFRISLDFIEFSVEA